MCGWKVNMRGNTACDSIGLHFLLSDVNVSNWVTGIWTLTSKQSYTPLFMFACTVNLTYMKVLPQSHSLLHAHKHWNYCRSLWELTELFYTHALQGEFTSTVYSVHLPPSAFLCQSLQCQVTWRPRPWPTWRNSSVTEGTSLSWPCPSSNACQISGDGTNTSWTPTTRREWVGFASY